MLLNTRKNTRRIWLKDLPIGGGAPISIQSMLSVPTADIASATAQIKALEQAGCEIIRFAVLDMDDARAIPMLRKSTRVPLVADIHFDHKLALAAM